MPPATRDFGRLTGSRSRRCDCFFFVSTYPYWIRRASTCCYRRAAAAAKDRLRPYPLHVISPHDNNRTSKVGLDFNYVFFTHKPPYLPLLFRSVDRLECNRNLEWNDSFGFLKFLHTIVAIAIRCVCVYVYGWGDWTERVRFTAHGCIPAIGRAQ